MKVIHELATNIDLKIVQDTELNNYTFDSVLLANFTKVGKKTKNIVDLCSGNAPIAMLIATKKDETNIKCVELQKEQCLLAKESIELNNFEKRIDIICDNLININKKIGSNFYDLVTCNPPYFRIDTASNINQSKAISVSRHEIEVKLEDVIKEASKLLNSRGMFTMVHRPDRLDEIILLLNKYKFSLKRLRLIYPRQNEKANTILIEATKREQISNKMEIESPLYVYDEGIGFTEETKKIMEF